MTSREATGCTIITDEEKTLCDRVIELESRVENFVFVERLIGFHYITTSEWNLDSRSPQSQNMDWWNAKIKFGTPAILKVKIAGRLKLDYSVPEMV